MPRPKLSYLLATFFVLSLGVALAQDPGDDAPPPWLLRKLGVDIDLRSGSRMLADELATSNGIVLPDEQLSSSPISTVPQVQLRGNNVQVNDPALDFTQIFPGFRPFLHFTQSETSVAASGPKIVATYNTSAGLHLSPAPSPPNPPGSLIVDRVNLSGFSTSSDGGQTWTSGFFPTAGPNGATEGDPSLGVDRSGNFHFAGLGTDAKGNFGIIVNNSTDGGQSWSPAVVVQLDNGADKEWLAVGPDPVQKNQDNIYVTWTSFQRTGAQLRLGRSTDGGSTWTTQTVFAPTPDPNPANPQNSLTFSNPVVDRFTGRLYIPFLQFSQLDQDFIRMLISDDGGETFSFATFNVPGAPFPTVLPITQPGTLTECGATIIRPMGRPPFISLNARLTIHAGPSAPGGVTSLPRFVQASRLTVQPALAARNGTVYLAWSNSTSLSFGDPASHSNILFMRSDDGGQTWTGPVQVNRSAANDVQHVLPALTIDEDPNGVHVLYFSQHADESVDVDLANSHDRGATFPADRTIHVTSTPFILPPSNVPIPSALQPFSTTNYDRQIAQCYALGEYLSVASSNGTVHTLFGSGANPITQPVNPLDPLSGQKHAQMDVFYQKVKAQ